jgi:CheY-like chemotaxis protein
MSQCILLVEDDLDVREATTEVLQDAGYKVASVSHGGEALEYLRSTPELPRVILLDLMMPIMDGWEFRHRQRSDPLLAGIPVVVLSADNALEQKVSKLGASAWLPKPFEVDRLLETVGRLC